MKVLLLAALVSVAVAMPNRGLVEVAPAGPAPAPELPTDTLGPISIGPAILEDFEPVDISPVFIEEPIIEGPTLVEEPAVPSPTGPLVQIILNINSAAGPAPVETAPTPVQVVDIAPVPVEPVIIGDPILPVPAVILPEELN